jgi:Putative phospholipid-binding domain.
MGSTNVILLCGKSNDPCGRNLDVEVTHDLDGLKSKLYELFPDESPKVLSSQGSIVLSGQVSGPQKMDAIYKIAETFLPQDDHQPGGGTPAPMSINVGGQAARRNRQPR